MHNRILIMLILLTMLTGIVWKSNAQSFREDNPFNYGFKVEYNAPLESDYSMIPGKMTLSGAFGFWGRVGKRYAGEVGIELLLNKRYFTNDTSSTSTMIETRYLQIPIRFRTEFTTFENQKIHAAIGVIWQQLIDVSTNNVGYSKKNLLKSPFVFTIGIGYSYRFVTFELNYHHFLRNFDIDNTKNKQKYLNLAVLIQF